MVEINIPQQVPHLLQKQLLALALIEPMAANYALFTEVSGQGDSKLFHNIIDLAWQQMLGHGIKVDWQKQRTKLETISPDPEAFDGYGVWPALDACVALSELITLLDENDESGLESIIKTYYSTIEQFLDMQGLSTDDSEQALYVEADKFIGEILEAFSTESKQVLAAKAVQTIVRAQTVSNIGIESSVG